ncbi:MAG TPA: sulfite exporter TauE/SafE family protein [Gemmatimonadales bacterium]|nr:sulfite exporter TauE/SafE family protein [Gemmatimonadales bacterium]
MVCRSTYESPIDSPLFLLALFAVGVLSGSTAAVIGFGIGSLLTPLLTLRLSAELAVAVVALPHLLATATRLLRHAASVDRPSFLRFGLLSAAGGLVGALLQSRLDAPVLLAVLGALLIATALANLTGSFGGRHPASPGALALGLLSGFFGGLVGNQGGLRAAGLLAFDLSPRAFLATSTAVALVVDLARTPVYLVRAGPRLWSLAFPIAVATAGCLVGTVWGERLLLRIGSTTYRRLVGAGVGVIGVWLLARAL